MPKVKKSGIIFIINREASMKYYKIINTKKGNRGLFYKEGYNEDPKPFIPSGDCGPGGIYFTREDILAFLNYGDMVCEVEPIGEVYENPGTPKKWKAHAVNLKFIGKWNSPKVLKKILDDGANIHTELDYALCSTAEKGYIKITKFLLDYGADVHAQNDYALRFAAKNGFTKVVKLLLKAGADVHALNDYALRYAAFNGHIETVKVLLEAGANVHVLSKAALHYIMEYGDTETKNLLTGRLV